MKTVILAAEAPGKRVPGRASRLRSRLRLDAAGWLVTGFALLVYLLAFHWGLPHATTEATVRGWDVDGIGGLNVLSELHNLLVDPKPDWYTAYPLFHYLVLAAAYAPYLAFLMATGRMQMPEATYPFGFDDPLASLLGLAIITRIVTLIMAVGTVTALYLVTKRVFDRTTAIVAAAAYALAGPVVYYARTGNLDMPVQFWTALGVVIAVDAVRSGLDVRRGLLLGTCAALAVATKDQAYGAWVAGLLFVGWAHWRHAAVDRRTRRSLWLPLAVLALTGTLVYAAANGIFLRPERFVRHVRYITGFEGNFFNVQHPTWITVIRPATPGGYAALFADIARAVWIAVGPILFLAGSAGMVVAARRSVPARLLACMLAGFVIVSLVPIRHMQYRYALLPAFVLAPFGAWLLVQGLRAGGVRRGGAAVALVAAFVHLSFNAADLTWQMARDARYAAGDWLRRELPRGATVGFFGIRHQLPTLPAGTNAIQLDAPGWLETDASAGRPHYLIVAPDYFSDITRERSEFLPDSIYRMLLDGSLGYVRTARFATPPLPDRPLPYLPYVNPQVQVFEHAAAAAR